MTESGRNNGMEIAQVERCGSAGGGVRDADFLKVESNVQFSFLQKVLYFFSYNRYALLIAIFSIAIVLASIIWGHWYIWVPVSLAALRALYWAWSIARQFPKKLHITKKLLLAQRQESFSPEDVVKYCADPCYRVVARGALASAGIGRRQRNALVREYTARARDLAHALVIVDPEKGRVLTIVGGVIEEKPMNAEGVRT